jgi:hypothetical protein
MLTVFIMQKTLREMDYIPAEGTGRQENEVK